MNQTIMDKRVSKTILVRKIFLNQNFQNNCESFEDFKRLFSIFQEGLRALIS